MLDVAIDFSIPTAAVSNISLFIPTYLWFQEQPDGFTFDEMVSLCREKNSFYLEFQL
jgi:hypothetical protein